MCRFNYDSKSGIDFWPASATAVFTGSTAAIHVYGFVEANVKYPLNPLRKWVWIDFLGTASRQQSLS